MMKKSNQNNKDEGLLAFFKLQMALAQLCKKHISLFV
jgi:hypothetical protein